jgi:hypothetical protein
MRLPARRSLAANGRRRIAHSKGDAIRPGDSGLCVLAVRDGALNVSETSFRAVLAGTCHEVPVNRVQDVLVNAAVVPEGSPVTVSVAAAGRVVPDVGVMVTA